MPPPGPGQASLIIVAVDGGHEITISDQAKTEILKKVLVFSGLGASGNASRLAFEAPKNIKIQRIKLTSPTIGPSPSAGLASLHRIAVFARNHKEYLEAACAIKDPSQLVTFQSEKRWVSAKKALDEQQLLKIYFAPIGSEGKITYEAVVKAIDLNPTEQAPLLAHRLPSVANEGVWGNTLYALSHCRSCPERTLSTLKKAEDGTALSEKFGYSYALVWEHEADAMVEPHPEEVVGGVKYVEGAVSLIQVNSYERNSAARQACVEHYGPNCSVCGFNFAAVYGEIGTGFIHIHHLKPLASIKDGYEVDPIEDLRPVCPNCHGMLHRRTPPFSIGELAAAIKSSMNGK